jgi:hypothetical protein
MKVLKIIVATAAGLFALAHCIDLPLNIMRGEHVSGLMGNVVGICIGAIVSILLFRSALSRPGPGRPPEEEG